VREAVEEEVSVDLGVVVSRGSCRLRMCDVWGEQGLPRV
jgi:hypothetical protein